MTAPDTNGRRPTVLLVDDDRDFARAVALLLGKTFDLHPVYNGEAALAANALRAYDAILLDVDLAEEPDGLEVLRRIRMEDSRVPIFMVTRMENPEVALEAGRFGATDYFTKGSPIDLLSRRIQSALQQRLTERHREAMERDPWAERWRFVGESEAVRKLRADAETLGEVETSVLITGEHGTGKEVLARYIHRHSTRAKGPFVAVNCAGIPSTLVENELFGHEPGAFTDAHGRRGTFELARGGTILLDEIAEMPLALQPKLLRVLESGDFTPLGSERVQHADARVICSTNRDLEAHAARGELRQDLYYRINVVQLSIPPLRERRMDILVLMRHFLERKATELGKAVEGFTPEAEALLLGHDWPGNARELENLIERTLVFCSEPLIGADLLTPIAESAGFVSMPWEEARATAMNRFEASYLTALLRVHRGQLIEVAQKMGTSIAELQEILKRNKLDPKNFRYLA
ncbi:MAG: sigma-54-dependent Fis family transcriptional regulator [Candidatus Eisenbacteria sp.]|nr:sigma-54-dependent Fis family transcriptional regulator [Candidatus Eisenbacteria bacterium]